MNKKMLLSFFMFIGLSQHYCMIAHSTTQEINSVQPMEDQSNSITSEVPDGYDDFDIVCQNAEDNYQPSASIKIPDWVSAVVLTLWLKYYDVKEALGNYWCRLKQAMSRKKIKN